MATESLKDQLKLLVKLAASDRQVSERESKFIHLIGKVNGFTVQEVNALLEHPEELSESFGETLTDDQRFDNLLHLIQMMKIDGKVHKSEIDFCEQMAVSLGYKKGVVSALSAYIYSSAMLNTDNEKLFKLANKYLAK
ncbi:MAG: hypothetical protein CRN43_07975 [Candidatus Nephrothrix sp. EaCA]|nr:MAG: hypothetical protein CRN43_07975 [Candidatus Nephrothrix sp. EaCA]